MKSKILGWFLLLVPIIVYLYFSIKSLGWKTVLKILAGSIALFSVGALMGYGVMLITK